jgi:hypothetical protein
VIISDKQIADLIQIANLYLRVMDRLATINPDCLSECGNHNIVHVARLLQTINEQQSNDMKVIQ